MVMPARPSKKKAAKVALKKPVRKNSYQKTNITKRVVPDFRGDDAYQAELADEIVARLSMGETLTAICKDEHLPNRMSVWNWCKKNPDLDVRMTKARLKQADSGFDEIMDIPDDLAKLAELGGLVTSEQIQLAKVRADARKFRVARLNRALYGDRTEVGLGGSTDGPPVEVSMDLSNLTPAEQKTMRELARKAITGRKGA
jgi:hypothetical protein